MRFTLIGLSVVALEVQTVKPSKTTRIHQVSLRIALSDYCRSISSLVKLFLRLVQSESPISARALQLENRLAAFAGFIGHYLQGYQSHV